MNKFVLVSHVVSNMENELREISHSEETRIHHALTQN